MSTSAEQAPPVSVLAAVLAGEPGAVSDTLAALERQVYGPHRVTVVGREADARAIADKAGVGWRRSLPAMLEALGPDSSHVWILRAGAVPRPNALGALITDSDRAGSPLAGSKILDRESPDALISVGLATDVFDVPYAGLDEGELDAGQYDVVRDVAAIDGTSLLVRRDLARGLGGFDPLLPPQAAATDLSQRARLREARVVVVPSSEVEFPAAASTQYGWREEAGSIRAMLKAYSLLTLVWAVPMTFLIGLVEAVLAPLIGRWTMFRFLRAWLWNVLHVFSTLRGRRSARRGGVLGDAELYRYQVRGSVKLRQLGDAAASRIATRLGPDERSNIADLGRELRKPAFFAGAIAVVFVAVATRSLWSGGFPASGYSLPLPPSGWGAWEAYAGGWNPGGFGSTEQLPPLVGFAGAVQAALFDNPELATAVLVVGAFLSAIWGMTRLLRTWDIGPIAGILGGAALIAGPAARALAADTGVGTLLALGVLPWTLRIPLVGWPSPWRDRIGRVAATAWLVAVLGLLSPPLVVVPAGALLVWSLVTFNESGAWRAAAVAGSGSVLALPVLLPWLGQVDLADYLDQGTFFWSIGILPAAVFGVAFVATSISVPPRLAIVTVWGGALTAGGAALARSGDFGTGRELGHLGLAVASLGTAVVVASATEGVRRVVEITGWRRMIVGVGALAGTVVAASALLVVAPGRAGLPAPTLADRIEFVAAADSDPSASRILLIGPAATLPGESRTVRGAGYRVVSAPMPNLWEAWLPAISEFDRALESDLEAMIDGDTFRAGEALAPYGIRWVISVGDTPLEDVFRSQLDLDLLGTREGVAFTSEGDPPARAVTEDGAVWSRDGGGYAGEPTVGRVLLAESTNLRWEPDAVAVGPAVSVSGSEGNARFGHDQRLRDQAVVAGVLLFLLVAAAWVGRRRV